MGIKQIKMEKNKSTVTKDEIEQYFVIKMNEYLNQVLQYQFNNYIFDMQNAWEKTEAKIIDKELESALRNFIDNSQFVKDNKLHSSICNLFNYDKKDVKINLYNHMYKFFHKFDFYPDEQWWDFHINKYEQNSNVWKIKTPN